MHNFLSFMKSFDWNLIQIGDIVREHFKYGHGEYYLRFSSIIRILRYYYFFKYIQLFNFIYFSSCCMLNSLLFNNNYYCKVNIISCVYFLNFVNKYFNSFQYKLRFSFDFEIYPKILSYRLSTHRRSAHNNFFDDPLFVKMKVVAKHCLKCTLCIKEFRFLYFSRQSLCIPFIQGCI